MDDIKPKEGYRENLIFIAFHKYKNLLSAIKENPTDSYRELKGKTGYSGGTLYNTRRDAKIMGLLQNGFGLKVTQLGQMWIESCGNGQYPNHTILKQACLNVPLFKKLKKEEPDLISPKTIIDYFLKHVPEDVDPRFIVSSVKRYLEGVHHIKTKSIKKFIKDRYKQKEKDISFDTYKKQDYDKGILLLKELKNNYSLTNLDIKSMIKVLPEKKRKAIEEDIFEQALEL